jgi:TonB family protein
VKSLRASNSGAAWVAGVAAGSDRLPFGPVELQARATGVPLAVSSALHAAVVATVVFISGALPSSESRVEVLTEPAKPVRMVYLMQPGPGGGGGGGGLRHRTPPPRAERRGAAALSNPLPRREAPKELEVVRAPEEPKPEVLETEPIPPIVAPVVTAPSDNRDRVGILEETTAAADSRGPGDGGGVGSGEGTGIGEGDGPGLGPGSGGGTGGGPYRPGSGITPPRLVREVKADYTEDARQRGLEGEVVLEIVVRRDGSVGDVRVIQRLGQGLDERAVAAVRQWRFTPARRLGAPVDVLVEVAVEFRLR